MSETKRMIEEDWADRLDRARDTTILDDDLLEEGQRARDAEAALEARLAAGVEGSRR